MHLSVYPSYSCYHLYYLPDKATKQIHMKWVKWPEGPALDSLRFSFSFACQLEIFPFSGQTLREFYHNLHFWFICALDTTKTQTQTHFQLHCSTLIQLGTLIVLYLSNYHSKATYLPLSLIRKHPQQVWTSFVHSHLYIHMHYVFMLNTKTCTMKAADLSCSSELHFSRYTILSQPSEPKNVWTWH